MLLLQTLILHLPPGVNTSSVVLGVVSAQNAATSISKRNRRSPRTHGVPPTAPGPPKSARGVVGAGLVGSSGHGRTGTRGLGTGQGSSAFGGAYLCDWGDGSWLESEKWSTAKHAFDDDNSLIDLPAQVVESVSVWRRPLEYLLPALQQLNPSIQQTSAIPVSSTSKGHSTAAALLASAEAAALQAAAAVAEQYFCIVRAPSQNEHPKGKFSLPLNVVTQRPTEKLQAPVPLSTNTASPSHVNNNVVPAPTEALPAPQPVVYNRKDFSSNTLGFTLPAASKPWSKWLISSFLFLHESMAAIEDNCFLWELIYPKDPVSKFPMYNPSGKYCVKLSFNGVWKKVTIT